MSQQQQRTSRAESIDHLDLHFVTEDERQQHTYLSAITEPDSFFQSEDDDEDEIQVATPVVEPVPPPCQKRRTSRATRNTSSSSSASNKNSNSNSNSRRKSRQYYRFSVLSKETSACSTRSNGSIYSTFAAYASPETQNLREPSTSASTQSGDIQQAWMAHGPQQQRHKDNPSDSSIQSIDVSSPSSVVSVSQPRTPLPSNSSSETDLSGTRTHEEHDSVSLAATHLWANDGHVCAPQDVAEWMGTNDPYRASVLEDYMQRFEFHNDRLDRAFRKLCRKLYFKAEAQQMDRIIEAFARRYHACNPEHTLLQNSDIIYAISYSLLLLNTDLHVVRENHRKMTRHKFVRHTLETVYRLAHGQESTAVRFREAFPMSESILSALSTASNMTSFWPRRSYSWRSIGSVVDESKMDDKAESSARPQRMWLAELEELLKELYGTIRAQQIEQAELPKRTEPIKVVRRKPGKIRLSAINYQQQEQQRLKMIEGAATENLVQDGAATVPTTESNYSLPPTPMPSPPVCTHVQPMREGVLMRKHIMESSDRKAKLRHWQACFVRVQDGTLEMQPTADKDKRRSMLLWSRRHDTESVDLNHALASNISPPIAQNKRHPHVLSLQTASGAVWLLEAPDLFTVLEWVATCNYWAALLSKEPLQGGVSNIDYGWSPGVAGDVPDWTAPMPCAVPSTLPKDQQCAALKQYANSLHRELEEHRQLKGLIDEKFCSRASSLSRARALANWDRKTQYLMHEMIKIRTYCDILDRV
ncbi:hypothetical protein BCR43DRAFT_484724 [Syncephalastrum racemosum]|uniref:SEC7 domain-containing protein n=1 Tax=Syncephalastrum racemosum TaxID=13706 RepID=A0A1X2HLI0_SYNRA|nr:hypothetical protein BCR43DRAFT_484724 [Syncephalastrum racemosum]